jgi:hypothetical protein
MRLRAWAAGEKARPVRVLVEMDGKLVDGPITYLIGLG